MAAIAFSMTSFRKAIRGQPDFKPNLSLASSNCSGETGDATTPKERQQRSAEHRFGEIQNILKRADLEIGAPI